MADLPDDLERLRNIAANLRDRLARIEARIKRLEDQQWREWQKARSAALGAQASAVMRLTNDPVVAEALTAGVDVPVADHAVNGWYAALADARLAARKAGNDWLVGKLNEIHRHLLAADGERGNSEIGKRSTSAATASGHELPNDTAATAASLSVANGGDARVASAGCPSGVPGTRRRLTSDGNGGMCIVTEPSPAGVRGAFNDQGEQP